MCVQGEEITEIEIKAKLKKSIKLKDLLKDLLNLGGSQLDTIRLDMLNWTHSIGHRSIRHLPPPPPAKRHTDFDFLRETTFIPHLPPPCQGIQ